MEEQQRNEGKRGLPFLALLLFALLLALLLPTAGVTLAKYVSEKASSGAAVAKPFYFSSDKLSGQSPAPYYQVEEPLEGQTVSFTFTLRNYVDSLRCTEDAISYSWQAVSPTGQMVGEGGGSGSLPNSGAQEQPITLSLSREDFLQADGGYGEVTVTVQANSPYEKVLEARVGFAETKGEPSWNVSEQENAVVLELQGGPGQTATVLWPSSLTPDFSNPCFSGASGNSVSLILNGEGLYTLTFLKNNQFTSYTKSDFTVGWE